MTEQSSESPGYLRWLWLALLFLLLLSLEAYNSRAMQPHPAIVISPTEGGQGTLVTVHGRDFPPDLVVSVRLGPPDVGATPQAYAVTTTSEDGTFEMVFVMPGAWPDGRLLTTSDLLVVVLNADASIKATAPFAYQPRVLQNPQ